MPKDVARAAAALPDIKGGSFWAGLTRELATRRLDFRKVNALYGSSEAARSCWSESYYGIIETADWLHQIPGTMPDATPIRRWAAGIFPGMLGRAGRRWTPVAGLSPAFRELERDLEAATTAVAEAAHAQDLAVAATPFWDRQVDESSDLSRSYRRAASQFLEVLKAIRSATAQTPGDRMLMRRAIQTEFGPEAIWRVNAKHSRRLGTTQNLWELREYSRSLDDRRVWNARKRKNIKEWKGLYK